MSSSKIHRADQTATAAIAAISQSISELLCSSRCNAVNLCARNSPMMRAIIAAAPDLRGSAHIFHAQLLHLARQRVAAPTQQLGCVLLHAISLAQRHADQDALDFGHGLIEQPLR